MDIKVSSFIPNGKIDIPSSKSYAHRALIAAFIANKGSYIKDINLCDDIKCTLNALKSLGANFSLNNNDVEFFNNDNPPEEVIIDVGSSGSTLRFLLPLASYLCKHVTFVGSEQLFSRPLSPYLDILSKQNIPFILKSSSLEILSSIKEDDFIINEDISSQFISGWLFLLAKANKSHFIKTSMQLGSKNYVSMTIDVLSKFGVKLVIKDNLIIHSFSHFNYLTYTIEKDYSQMAFFATLGALKGNVTFSNMNISSLQGDKQIIDILIDGGAKTDFLGENITFFHSLIKGQEIDISNCIDLGPILFVLGACSFGQTKLINTKRLTYKESNRLFAMKEELEKCGVKIDVFDNEVIIQGNASYQGDYHFSSHNDHRICMALAIFSVINHGTCTISNYECVNKSYPNFFNDLFSLNKEAL